MRFPTWRMAYRVTCPGGAVLEKGDVIEWYSPKRHRDVPRPLLASARVTVDQMKAKAGEALWLQPCAIMHDGKLHVLERKCITNREPGSRRAVRAIEQPQPAHHETQRELFD